jgi:hypothetical protein
VLQLPHYGNAGLSGHTPIAAALKRNELALAHIQPLSSRRRIVSAQRISLIGAETGNKTIAAAHSHCRLMNGPAVLLPRHQL